MRGSGVSTLLRLFGTASHSAVTAASGGGLTGLLVTDQDRRERRYKAVRRAGRGVSTRSTLRWGRCSQPADEFGSASDKIVICALGLHPTEKW
jgi:hypothetical protein